jgi:2-phospho-L-lactate guanylyltransferase
MSIPPLTRFCVLVPVKATARAKSRLAPLGDETRRALVEAFAVDTVTAALASPLVERVLVITDDHLLAARLRDAGAHVVPDGVVDDLNGSLVQGAAEARRRWPHLALAALCADLPSLRADDLTRALTSASDHERCFVPDQQGDGTTMVSALPGADLMPSFGPGSRDAHAADGAHELLEVEAGTLRRDVDTPEDLREALRLGVGPCTTAVAVGRRL